MSTTAKQAYKNHRAGSRKGEVHRIFDKKGRDVAMEFGRKRKLAESTLRSWFSAWPTSRKRAAA